MTASSPKQRWRRGQRVIRGRSNPGKGAGRGWGNSERRGGRPVEGEDHCSWCSVPHQSERRGGGRGREGVGRARSTAGRPSGSGRDRNPVKIRVRGRFNHGSVPIGLFLKGDAPLSKRTKPGARGRGPAALEERGSCTGLGTWYVLPGERRFISLSLPARWQARGCRPTVGRGIRGPRPWPGCPSCCEPQGRRTEVGGCGCG